MGVEKMIVDLLCAFENESGRPARLVEIGEPFWHTLVQHLEKTARTFSLERDSLGHDRLKLIGVDVVRVFGTTIQVSD